LYISVCLKIPTFYRNSLLVVLFETFGKKSKYAKKIIIKEKQTVHSLYIIVSSSRLLPGLDKNCQVKNVFILFDNKV